MDGINIVHVIRGLNTSLNCYGYTVQKTFKEIQLYNVGNHVGPYGEKMQMPFFLVITGVFFQDQPKRQA